MTKGTMWIALCAVIGFGLLLVGLAPAHEQNSNGTMTGNANGNSNSNMGGNMNGNMNGMNHNMSKSSDMPPMPLTPRRYATEDRLPRRS